MRWAKHLVRIEVREIQTVLAEGSRRYIFRGLFKDDAFIIDKEGR
jgi:hypothetical protein